LEIKPKLCRPPCLPFQAMKQKFGFLPNIMATMADNPTFLNGFAGLFGSFHSGSLNECEKQTLLLTNSVTLKCPWTIAAHSYFALEDGMTESDVNAIRNGRLPSNPKYAALSRITKAPMATAGNATEADIEKFTSAGYSQAQLFEVVMCISLTSCTS
jgi:alkylhydroperoxidase family enzyme